MAKRPQVRTVQIHPDADAIEALKAGLPMFEVAYTPRQWRAARIQRFTEEQRQTLEWINFADIADWCSKEDHSIIPSEDKRAAAFDTLASDLLSGVFEENGRSRVLYLNPATTKARMTRAWLRDVIHHNYDNKRGTSQFLPHCWIPRGFFERWLARHRLQQSPSRFEPIVERASTRLKKAKARSLAGVQSEVPTRSTRFKFRGGAKSIGIREAIGQIWPNGPPQALAAKERNRTIIRWLEENQYSISSDPKRAIQRVLKEMKKKAS
jgi:hypothetical protein